MTDRIAAIRTHRLAIAHRQRYHWAIGAPTGTNNVLVEIETTDGLIGIGDACGTRSAVATAAVIDSVAGLLIGEDPTRIEWHLGRMYRAASWSNQRRFANQAFAGIEMALWDLSVAPSTARSTSYWVAVSTIASTGSDSCRASRPRTWRRTRSVFGSGASMSSI